MPYNNIHFLTDEKIDQFNINEHDMTGQTYLILCDLAYPSEIKTVSRYLPFCPSKTTVVSRIENAHHETEQVQVDLTDKCEVLLADFNLKNYLSLGMQLKKIHRIVAFETKIQFEPFKVALLTARETAPTNFLQRLMKKIGVYCVGVFGQKLELESLQFFATKRKRQQDYYQAATL